MKHDATCKTPTARDRYVTEHRLLRAMGSIPWSRASFVSCVLEEYGQEHPEMRDLCNTAAREEQHLGAALSLFRWARNV